MMMRRWAILMWILGGAVAAGAAAPTPALREAYGGRFAVGAAIPSAPLSAAEQALLVRQFGTVTPENCMKPKWVQPIEGQFRFGPADALVAMAQAGGLTVNGHTLVWHEQCPTWFFEDAGRPADRQLVLQRLRAHVATVAGRYAGKVASWDVVNEAIADGPGYLRSSPWLERAGEEFIAESFRAARRADPAAALYYNDYGIESGAKRDKALRLLRELRAQGVPVDGVGIQGHWQLDRIPWREVEDAIVAFHSMGLKVAITELDIDVVPRRTAGAAAGARESGGGDPFAAGLPPEMQQRLAAQYAQLFTLFTRHADKIARVTFWGLHDGRSWLNTWPRRRTNHALLWDRALAPKPALAAVLEVAQTTAGAR